MELAFKAWGTQVTDREKIVLLHGLGGTGALWRPISAALENQFALMAPDQRGHGGSRISDAAEYSPLDYGQDVVETLSHHGFHPAWLIGHSMGVRTAVAAAHLRPELVRGLVLIDLGFAGAAGGGLGDTLGDFLRILPSRFPSRAEGRAFMDAHCPDPSIGQYLMAVSTPTSDGGITFPFDHSALIRTIEAARTTTLRPWIRELASQGMPILALRGARSLVWTHEEFEEEKALFSDRPQVEFVEVEGAGHGLPFEKRQEFIQLVTNWMARCRPPGFPS